MDNGSYYLVVCINKYNEDTYRLFKTKDEAFVFVRPDPNPEDDPDPEDQNNTWKVWENIANAQLKVGGAGAGGTTPIFGTDKLCDQFRIVHITLEKFL
jgi:hypothetical protein